MILADRLSHRTSERRSRCHTQFFKHCVNHTRVSELIIAKSRRLASRNSYENASRFLLVPLADQVPFEQTRCAQTELSVAPARAVLATESLLGSRYLFCYQIFCASRSKNAEAFLNRAALKFEIAYCNVLLLLCFYIIL